MNETELNTLRDRFTDSLQKLYDTEVIAALMEFCQGEIRVLLYLYANRGKDIYPFELSDALFVSRQRITAVLSALRKKKYVSMVISEEDRRKMKVMLTGPGEQYIEGKQESAVANIDSLISALGGKNIAELTRIIGLITGIMTKNRNESV